MTCIIGLKHDGKVYMGGDSCVSYGNTYSHHDPRKKVFRNLVHGLLIGCSGSTRYAQLVAWHLDFPVVAKEITAESDPEKFIYRTFIPALQKMLRDHSFITRQEEHGETVASNGNLLVGVYGQLFLIGSNFSADIVQGEFEAVGSGQDFAMGVLAALPDLPPEERILRALEIASQFDNYTKPPFVVLSI